MSSIGRLGTSNHFLTAVSVTTQCGAVSWFDQMTSNTVRQNHNASVLFLQPFIECLSVQHSTLWLTTTSNFMYRCSYKFRISHRWHVFRHNLTLSYRGNFTRKLNSNDCLRTMPWFDAMLFLCTSMFRLLQHERTTFPKNTREGRLDYWISLLFDHNRGSSIPPLYTLYT